MESVNVDLLLDRIYADGQRNDAAVSRRDEMMLNVTPSTGVFLVHPGLSWIL
ncbi:MAG: hypothetical protein WBD31_24325 [Rubripirellula sp.]